jgi:tetratricopeptide (TPR) repeat protein
MPILTEAETKATKAIQKHSMNIGGSEKNPQMDEAYLMLGKARYYDQRFVPALDAFNYVLYKSPQSNKIYEAKIWREKTNMRLDNDALAVNNLRTLLHEIKFKDQIFADANATLAQAFLNLEQKDSAVAKLKLARDFTKLNEEKARYRFILGQLYEQQGQPDSAYAAYQSVIDMKRKSARQYVVYSHIRQATQFDYAKGDTTAFVEKFNKLLKDRENRPYLYALNHQMAVFYDKGKKPDVAIKYYNKSLKTGREDQYLTGVNYKNLAEIYFYKAKYLTAGKYYDSTLVQLNVRSREYKAIKKKRDNLEEVIKYEGIASRNDSIIKIYNLSEADRKAFFEAYVAKLRKAEEAKKALREAAIARGEEVADENTGKEPLPDVDANGRNVTPVAQQRSEKPAQEPNRPKHLWLLRRVISIFTIPLPLLMGKPNSRKTGAIVR